MTRDTGIDIDIDRVLDRWLAEGSDVLPDRVLHEAAAQIERTTQRGAWRSSRRNPAMFSMTRLALAAGGVAVIVFGAVATGVFRPPSNTIGAPQGPSPTGPGTPALSSASDLPARTPLSGTIFFDRYDASTDTHVAFTVAPDGSRLRPFLSGDVCCAIWSGDGRRVMVTVTVNGRTTTAFVAPDGTGYREIGAQPAGWNVAGGAWSIDGTQIAYEVSDDSTPAVNGIYLSTGAGRLRRLTTPGGGAEDRPVAFSPTSRQLLFVRVTQPGRPALGDLYLISIDGTGLRRLNAADLPVTADFDGPASWSPHGVAIAFSVYGNGPTAGVYVAPAAGGLARQLARANQSTSARYSPDGQSIVFDSAISAGEHELVVAASDGSTQRGLDATVAGSCCAQWSPDSAALVFQRGGDTVQLLTIRVDDSDLTQVTTDQAGYGHYRWGSWVP